MLHEKNKKNNEILFRTRHFLRILAYDFGNA